MRRNIKSRCPWSSIVADGAETAWCSLSDEVLYTPSWAIFAASICTRGRVSPRPTDQERKRERNVRKPLTLYIDSKDFHNRTSGGMLAIEV